MYLADYHCHSNLSFDGKAPLPVLARHMAAAGVQEMCLTDHCDLLDPDARRVYDYDWPTAIARFDAAAEQFSGQLTMKLGLEFGMGHIDPPASEKILSHPRIDFVIGSIHNLSPEQGGADLFFEDMSTPESCARLLDDYFTSMEHLVRTDYYDVLGHINYPLRYMHDLVTIDPYLDRITEILRIAISKGKGIECNTNRGTVIQSWTPSLNRYRDLGGEIITTGSDTHDPTTAGAGLSQACALLKSLGFRATCTFDRHNPVFHDL